MLANAVETRAKVLALLQRHGWNATSFQALEAGFRYWLDGDDACVAYVETRGAWVAAGAPIAAPDQLAGVAERFCRAAAEAGKRCVFFAAEQRVVDAASLHALRVGEQPVWDPAKWPDKLKQVRSLREQLRRAENKGVTVRPLAPEELEEGQPLRQAIVQLIDRWQHDKPMAPMGFLVDVQPFEFAAERMYFVAERDSHLVGFVAAVPIYGRQGWLIEDFLRDPEAPNGTAELMIDRAMREAARRQSHYVTLGLAPLAGPVAGWLKAARTLSTALYDFRGLRAFKAKLRPDEWEPIFVAHPQGSSSHLALVDALQAFARGSFVRFGAATLLRGPAVVVRVLAALLVPWMVVLALSPAAWFPWPWVKTAWIAFDALLAAALFSLTARWRRWLGATAAIAVTGDAMLTWTQVLSWDLPRLHSLRELVWIVVSVAGPSLGALVLWAAVGHRSRRPSG